ncbi:transcriptional regulator [Lithohypha guttulata]|uniref:transcriptional regulator n=1 Tax=Lithohypha guttulata TaxID=1690604 RepID=UPI002DE0F641|nr:transcriptional regulator [Lithohypha guttulata]KAK5098688.1 transcriptional regulator [Lithohypha guttulata]
MASVQPAAMQQPSPLPVNTTQQQIQAAYEKYKLLKAQNVPNNDPEFVRLQQFLTHVQQQQQMRKLAHQKQQQMMQAKAQMQGQPQGQMSMNGQANGAVMNGMKPADVPVDGPQLTSNGSGPAATNQQHSAPGQVAPNAGQGRVGPGGHPFTSEQLQMLRMQIQAFKMLSKNTLLPQVLKDKLRPRDTGAMSQASSLEAAEKVLKNAAEGKESAPADMQLAKVFFESYTNPYDLFPRSISFADHSQRSKRPLIPALLPYGIDIEQVREDRERAMYNRIQARKAELAAMPVNIAAWDTSKSKEATDDDSLRMKTLIEFKKLSLLQRQREFRREIQQELFNYDNLAMTANRSLHRRMKKQSLREAKITEKLEKQQRDARENKEKTKANDQLLSVIAHGHEIKQHATNQRARVQKLGKLMVAQHQYMEREEQKRIERTAKQRLQALKANDEETYLKLLGQAKDSRITHLLKQTDGFLNQLAASVREQQRSTAQRYGDVDDFAPEDEEGSEDEDGGRKIDYYAVAHRIKEEVTAQPTILVGGTLKEYQLKGLQWMVSLYNNRLNGVLADEMGLGKTIQTISLITYLIEQKQQPGPFLVIVPLSTLTNWNLEFDKWAPSVSKIVYKGPPNSRKQQQQRIRSEKFQVLLTTYEYIIKDRPVLSKIKWIHMIIDEGHRMKNAQSKLSSTLSQYYSTRYRLILTGTPLQNNLTELWAILNFVLPNIFKSASSFDEWFNTPFANTGGQDRMELTEEEQLLVIRRLHKVLRPFLLRRLKKDVEKDLPDKQERVIKCRFSALQAKLNLQLMNHNKLAVADGKGGKTSMRGLSNMLMQLRKLCNHPYVFEPVEDQMNPGRGTNDSIWRTAGKFELLDRVLPKFAVTGHRVLMFFQMTQIMNIMEDFLRLRGYKYLRLDGATKADERSDLLRLFNAPDSPYFCFLLSTRAGGLGLNLQTADTVIIYDSDWNPHQDLQAQDRAHRIGQKNEVRILRLISTGSVEEKILERAQYKLDMDGKVIQAGKFDNKSTNEERDAFLRTLLETAEAAEAGDNQEEMEDDDLNEIMARSEEELVLFQKMDKERQATDPYGPGKPLPRLMGESELPDIYLQEDEPEPKKEDDEFAGRGARVKTQVRYDDGLTEEQWLAAVDDSDDSIGDAVKRKQARIDKRRTNKAKRENGTGGASSVASSRESTEEPVPQPKKRGRKPGPLKRKAEEEPEETPTTKRKRGRQKVDLLSTSDRALLQKSLTTIIKTIKNLEVEESDPGTPEPDDDEEGPYTRQVIPPFLEIPPKKLYPDYHSFIPNPIAIQQIDEKINGHKYNSLADLQRDIQLLATNAKTYNEDGSMLYNDATMIEKKCIEMIAQQQSDNPGLLTLGEGDTNSTMDGSSMGTPRPSVPPGGTKLKLNFSAMANGSHGASSGTE